jgi:hypothetical protein
MINTIYFDHSDVIQENERRSPIEKIEAWERIYRIWICLKLEPEWWKYNWDIVSTLIVKQNPFAIRYSQFCNNKKMGLLAVNIHGLSRYFLSDELKQDREIRQIAEKKWPTSRMKVQTETHPERDDRIFFVTSKGCSALTQVLEFRENIINKITFHCLEGMNKYSAFIRDSHVTLFDEKHLIPYPIRMGDIDIELKKILPSSADHMILWERNGETILLPIKGAGFRDLNVHEAIISAFDYNFSYQEGRSCIEGGNCYLFTLPNGERMALIGEISRCLTLLALEEQRYFDHKKKIEYSDEPSIDAYRITRNRALYPRKAFNDIMNNQNKYLCLFKAPISKEEKMQYRVEASQIEMKLLLTKKCMANELGLPMQNIIFMPQTKFHIDMEMFIAPNGEVVLHDDDETLYFLNKLYSTTYLDREERDLFFCYYAAAQERAKAFSAIQKKRIEILQQEGMRYRLFPGILEAKNHECTLNYCNGVFAENWGGGKRFTYITTGPTLREEEVFHQKLSEVFEETFPDVRLQGVNRISHCIEKREGGIRCLTFENSLPF